MLPISRLLQSFCSLRSKQSQSRLRHLPESYCESINTLYAANTFHIGEIATFERLSSILLPPRVQAISSLKLYLWLDQFPGRFPDVKRRYEEVWRQIASMRGLHELRVAISFMVTGQRWEENEEAVLAPIREFPFGRRLKHFEVTLPVRSDYLSPGVQTGTCRVRGREEKTFFEFNRSDPYPSVTVIAAR